jgi:predicted nucleotidyltransferase
MGPNTPSGLLAAELEAEVLLDRALLFCADRMHVSTDQVVQALREGVPEVHSTLRYAVAKGLGDYLRNLRCDFRAVYLYGSTMTGNAGIASDIDLIVVVEHKLDQVRNLLQRLDLALVTSYRSLLGLTSGLAKLIDVHIVDVEERLKRHGYGAVLCSSETSPVCLWRLSPKVSGAPVGQGPPVCF